MDLTELIKHHVIKKFGEKAWNFIQDVKDLSNEEFENYMRVNFSIDGKILENKEKILLDIIIGGRLCLTVEYYEDVDLFTLNGEDIELTYQQYIELCSDKIIHQRTRRKRSYYKTIFS